MRFRRALVLSRSHVRSQAFRGASTTNRAGLAAERLAILVENPSREPDDAGARRPVVSIGWRAWLSQSVSRFWITGVIASSALLGQAAVAITRPDGQTP